MASIKTETYQQERPDQMASFCAKSVQCPGFTEFYVCANRNEGEEALPVLQRVADFLTQQGAEPVVMDLFGMEEIEEATIPAVMGKEVPVTWVKEDDGGHSGGVLAWGIAGVEIERLHFNNRCVGVLFEDTNAQYCRLNGVIPPDLSQDRVTQAQMEFETFLKILQEADMDFSNVVRTWFYNHNILDWYASFNKVRDTFFREHQIFEKIVPASTAIGGANPMGAAMVGGLLAVKPKSDMVTIEPLASPLQCPALEYGSSFSRALEVDTEHTRRVFVSGTAGIAMEGHTIGIGDTRKQTLRTLEVVLAILESRGMNWEDVISGMAYVRFRKDMPLVTELLNHLAEKPLPILISNNTVCRDDLLFELEVIALQAH